MVVECKLTPLRCCSNSILHTFCAIITPRTDFDLYGVLQQHSNFNSVVLILQYKLVGTNITGNVLVIHTYSNQYKRQFMS